MEEIKTQVKKVDFVNPKELVYHSKNMNKHPQEQIDRLIKLISYQGFRVPLIVQMGTNLVISGNGRLEAALKMGLESVPVIYQEFDSEAQLYAFMVSDNAIQSWSHLDLSMINQEILDLGPEIDLDNLGLKDFVVEPIEKLPEIVDSESYELPTEPISKKGDVWICGPHRVCCGDSTSVDDIQRLMNNKTADLVFTDPPYRMEAEGGSNQLVGKAARALGEKIHHLCNFDPVLFLNALPLVFEKNVMNAYIFCNKDLVPDYLNWAIEAGYSFNILFWKKPSAIPLGGSHRPDVEYLLLFRRSAIWNNGVNDVVYSKCLEFGRVQKTEENGKHPTPKPVELIENEILISSNKESIVVDFFLGSGSSLIACEKRGRVCHGMELDPRFVDVSVRRWAKATGQDPFLEDSGKRLSEF